MNQRTLSAVLICTGIWLAYIQWFAPKPVPRSQPVAESTTGATNSSSPGQNVVSSAGAANPTFPGPLVLGSGPEIQTERFQIQLSQAGGKPASVKLKKYRQTIEKNSPEISPITAADESYSLATLFTDPSLSSFSGGQYQPLPDGRTFSLESNGVKISKSYAESKDAYLVNLDVVLRFPQGSKRDWGHLILPLGAQNIDFDASTPLKSWEVAYSQNGSVARTPGGKLPEEGKVLQGNTQWLSFGNRYFSTAVVNKSDLNPDVVLVTSQYFKGGYLRYPVYLKEGQQELKYSFTIYAGPKDFAELSKENGLTQLIDYGMFKMFAFPLVKVLRFFHSVIPNYGVAIILLTIFVRLLFFPLQAKSVKSMKAMQKIQPQLAALREKHKDDMAKFNQEQIALFKAHKVNPMGSCLPLLVQLPVLFALYAVIGNSIELFHAPFFGWIHDLSVKDPFYIYPVLMGISMFVQQKLTPSAGMDPAQQKLMMFMPVMFSFMMVGLPAGLTMYIFVSTVLGIAQQVLTRDKNTGPATIAVAPAK